MLGSTTSNPTRSLSRSVISSPDTVGTRLLANPARTADAEANSGRGPELAIGVELQQKEQRQKHDARRRDDANLGAWATELHARKRLELGVDRILGNGRAWLVGDGLDVFGHGGNRHPTVHGDTAP